MSLAADFAKVDLKTVVESLTLEEAVSLTAGANFWYTAAVPRLKIPRISVSDGPNGVRGLRFFNMTPASCIPCGTALGATWDTDLVRKVAEKLLGPEVKQRTASVILAPTCNLIRSPLGGRVFECYSEDPHLAGMIAAAFINGIQKCGIAACVKHFVGNEQEDDREGVDSQISERALREVYLYPFMLAERLSKPMCYMTSHNKLNGTHTDEHTKLLQGVLRGEWGSEAMIMSDWFGTYSLYESLNAGLDLEMPGLGVWRTVDKIKKGIKGRKITEKTVKERATKVLELVQKLCKTNAEVIDGDGVERYSRNDDDSDLMRKVAAQSIVLLKNDAQILPLNPASLKKVAIIGPNAKATHASGGGSAALRNSYVVSPYTGLAEVLQANNVDIEYHEGCQGHKSLPLLDWHITTATGNPGWTCEFYAQDTENKALSEPLHKTDIVGTHIWLNDVIVQGLTARHTVRVVGKTVPREADTPFRFGLTVAGRAKLFLDREVVIDNWTFQTRGSTFFGMGTVEETGDFILKAGVAHDILIEFENMYGPTTANPSEAPTGPLKAIRLGGAPILEPEVAIQEAVSVAKGADVAVVVVGLNGDWEIEGIDRNDLNLPGLTDSLVAQVAAANPNTIVVNQSGSAVLMPWAHDVAAVVQSWYGGNESGNAIADVLFGKVNPSGKMPFSFPKRLEDVPSHGHFGSENGKVRYAEDLDVGYKGYQKRKVAPLWPFGFGLCYTTFKWGPISTTGPNFDPNFNITIAVDVTNTGAMLGSEIVQVYVELPKGPVTSPQNQLRAFSKVRNIQPGETRTATITLDKYAVSYWDDSLHKWRAEKGTYKFRVGSSSDRFEGEASFVLEDPFEWSGL